MAGNDALNYGRTLPLTTGITVVMFGIIGEDGFADGATDIGGMYDGVTGW